MGVYRDACLGPVRGFEPSIGLRSASKPSILRFDDGVQVVGCGSQGQPQTWVIGDDGNIGLVKGNMVTGPEYL